MRKPLIFLSLLLGSVSSLPAANLSVDGDRFRLDGELIDLYGIRVASAIGTQAYTDQLIEQLDGYKAHGVNAVTVFYQGSSGGHYDPFTPDGTGWRFPEFRDRMDQIIEACDERDMVCVVGIFYQWKNQALTDRSVLNWDAAKEAVRTVANHLESKGYRNIILNVANEQNSGGYSDEPWGKVSNVSDLLDMVGIAKAEHPGLIVGCGGYDHSKNLQLGNDAAVDVLLFDTLGPGQQEGSGYYYEYFVSNGVDDKPIINVEMFGGWTKKFTPQGVFDTSGKNEHYNEVDDAHARPGLSVFFHSNTWCQGPSVGSPVRFDLAGQGTSSDPGIRWWFDYVLTVTSGGDSNRDPSGSSSAPSEGSIQSDPGDPEVVAEIFATSTSGNSPLTVDFDASASLDLNGNIVRYEWNFGDGSTGSGVSLSHTYNTPDTNSFNAILTVTDNDGNTATDNVLITVTPEGSATPEKSRFIESGGILVIEAEHFATRSPSTYSLYKTPHEWHLFTDKEGYSGNGFLQVLPDEWPDHQETGPRSPRDNSGAELTYPIRVTTPGTYFVYVRGMSMGGESNGIHLGINGQLAGTEVGASNMSGFRPYNEWIWESGRKAGYSPPATLELPEGDHTLHVWNRDDGFRIDKIVLRRTQTRPNRMGPAESERATGTGYAMWSAGFESSPDGDENGDGVSNLLAYGLGAGPFEDAGHLLPNLQAQNAEVRVFEFNQAGAVDLQYDLEYSTDSTHWTLLAQKTTASPEFSVVHSPQAVTIEQLGATIHLLDMRVLSNYFYLLRISRPIN